MELPKLNAATRRVDREIVQMRGINYGDRLQDGDLADSKNVSARRFPYLATRKAREKQEPSGGIYSFVTAMTAWNELVVVNEQRYFSQDVFYYLYYGTSRVGEVSGVNDGRKQFAVVNTKLVIWPDKKYLDLSADPPTLKDLGATASPASMTFDSTIASETATANRITVTGEGLDLTTLFSPGDGLKITGCTTNTQNNTSFVVKEVTATTLTAMKDGAFVPDTETASVSNPLAIVREIPDMDYICESENRLWGCNSATQTIYVSALGDPCNFNVAQGIADDSYAFAVSSAGDFTGCCKLGSSVLFWKENVLYKVLGSYPAEYQMHSYAVEGLRAGCHKSLQVINEVLYYVGLHGVYAYTGSAPSLISSNFGERDFTDAVAGSDGDSYYLSCRDARNPSNNDWHMFVYETRAGIWVHEDYKHCIDFARIGRDLFFVEYGHGVWKVATASDDVNLDWLAQFAPFYETTQERKRYSKLHFRFELPSGSSVSIYVRTDGGDWKLCATVIGSKTDVVRVRVPLSRGDKWEVKLTGTGACTLLAFEREFSAGGDL